MNEASSDNGGQLKRLARNQDAYERFERVAEVPMLVLSILFIPVILVPAFIDHGAAELGLAAVSAFIWGAFVIEYLVLLYLAPSRRHMVRTHIFDLIIIAVPVFRPLRALRSVRLLRGLAAVGRSTQAIRRITSRPGFTGFLAVVLGFIAAGAALVWSFERAGSDANIDNFADALWWAVVTSTTVGYGDFTPTTLEGRAVAAVLMLVGIGLLSVVTAHVAAYFVQVDEGDALEAIRAELAELRTEIAELNHHLVGEGAARH